MPFNAEFYKQANLQNLESLKLAVLQDGSLLKHVDANSFQLREYAEICFNALVQNSENIQFIQIEELKLHFEQQLDMLAIKLQ